jgi:hypothetical protein
MAKQPMVFESLSTSTLTSTEYYQTTWKRNVTNDQIKSIDVLTAAFTDAGFSFTLKKTTEHIDDAWSAALALPKNST